MAMPSAPIDAISGESVNHNTPFVISAVEPSLYFPVALNCMLSLMLRVELGELTETDFKGDSPLHSGNGPVHVGLLLPQAARQRQAKDKRNFLIRNQGSNVAAVVPAAMAGILRSNQSLRKMSLSTRISKLLDFREFFE